MTALIITSLFVVSHHADYLLQAYQHGWKTWYTLKADAPKWGMFDFIPHDSWHVVQWVRNNTLVLAVCIGTIYGSIYIRPLWAIAAMFVTYGITRGLGFSLFVKYYAKR